MVRASGARHNKRSPHSWWRRRRLLRRVEVTVTDDGCWRLTWRGQGRLPGQGAMAAPPWIGLMFSLRHERSLRWRSRSPDDCRRSPGSRGRIGAPAVRTTAAGTPGCRSRRSAGRPRSFWNLLRNPCPVLRLPLPLFSRNRAYPRRGIGMALSCRVFFVSSDPALQGTS